MAFIEGTSGYLQKLKSVFGFDIEEDSMLEQYLKKQYAKRENIAYRQKRKIQGLGYSIFLNELVTPEAFVVKKFMKGQILSSDLFGRVRSVGNKIAQAIEWTDDHNLDTSGDYYLYPSETLTLQWGDCEDHVFIFMSCLPNDVGGAWGFWKEQGHAFNVFVLNNELWIADTTGNEVITKKYSDQSDYKINYIITKRYTFQLDGSTQFGEIAGW